MSEELLETIQTKIKSVQGDEAIKEAKLNFDKPMVILDTENWNDEVMRMLHDDDAMQFDFLTCVTGVDYEEHMEAIYNLYSTTLDQYLYVKVVTPRENPVVSSGDPVWKSADYMEREIYDLLGITFTGHWNMSRILLEDDWEGHPLRKDYITDKKALGLD